MFGVPPLTPQRVRPRSQHGGALWPSETCKVRASRRQQDARLGNISLIPLRGNESEMRSSVAAFATDPLTVSLHHTGGALMERHHPTGRHWGDRIIRGGTGGGPSWNGIALLGNTGVSGEMGMSLPCTLPGPFVGFLGVFRGAGVPRTV